MKETNHLISMLVDDQPGVLTRIAGMIARRGYNIETIAVGKTNNAEVSKMVFGVKGDDKVIEQIVKQVSKLVDTVKVTEMKSGDSITRELCLVKVSSKTKKEKDELFHYSHIYKAKFVDVDPKSMTLELIGQPKKIDSFLELIKSYGIQDISRTGPTAINRSSNGK